MMSRRGILGLPSLLAFPGCSVALPAYRYKLSGSAVYDGKLCEGSSVVEVRTQDTYGLERRKTITGPIGQATVIDLGDDGVIFALLNRIHGAYDTSEDAYWTDTPTGMLATLYDVPNKQEIGPVIDSIRASRRKDFLKPHECPAIAYARNRGDPTGIVAVNAAYPSRELGSGLSSFKLSIEIVEEEVSSGITSTFPWLKNGRGSILRIQTRSNPFNYDDFRQGVL